MAVSFGRGGGPAEVHVDHERCNGCGLCVRVCKGGPLRLTGGRPQTDGDSPLGCIACGHCAAICPQGCISIRGRDLYPEDLVELPPPESRTGYGQLQGLLLTRRSVREYQPREVEPALVEQILEAASSASMGLPPSEVGVLVLAGRGKVQAFRSDLLAALQRWRRLLSPPVLTLLRPFVGREEYEMFRGFVRPAIELYIEKDRQGIDWFFYDAPLALHFYGSGCADATDPVIAATYAMLAAESLGLGSCLLGFPGYILQYDGGLRRKYGLPGKIQPGLAMALGYPALRYRRGVRRRFAQVKRI